MRLPKGRFIAGPGPKSERAEEYRAHGVSNPDGFYDPDGKRFGLPTYPFHLAPAGYATRRQLRKQNLCPGGQPIQAQIVWKHGGRRKDGRGSTVRRVAYLYAVSEARPKRECSPAQREAVEKALAARRTCPICGVEQKYYISRSKGECNKCSDPELYASGDPADEADWQAGWAPADDDDWDPGQPEPEPEFADFEAG